MAKFVVSIRDYVLRQQKELMKPFLNSSSELMVNPVYSKYVKTGYWQNSIASINQFLKAIPEFDLEPVSVVTDDTSKSMEGPQETADDVDLLVGYISEKMAQDMKNKVSRL